MTRVMFMYRGLARVRLGLWLVRVSVEVRVWSRMRVRV